MFRTFSNAQLNETIEESPALDPDASPGKDSKNEYGRWGGCMYAVFFWWRELKEADEGITVTGLPVFCPCQKCTTLGALRKPVYRTTRMRHLKREGAAVKPRQGPLPNDLNKDGSYSNPSDTPRSRAYTNFLLPVRPPDAGPGFDVHDAKPDVTVYYLQHNETQVKQARVLHDAIRREFPELKIYPMWDRPVGPHPVAMFEVNIYTPAQFGAFIPWIMFARCGLSVLVHPHTGCELRDHTTDAIWLGEPYRLDTSIMSNSNSS
ncbi:hypothetical protein HK104_001693 [Borealophlyctis nickersoniae]|nr:hypothetical protein HK104_001693 [Borealophlyctis nickersoniae]